jgi:AcrR family transcriptional regulator
MGANAMTDEDKEHHRRTLLDAAHGLFRERRDLRPVTEIAKAAGLAKETVYLYFTSKEEIFIALIEDNFAKLFEALASLANGVLEQNLPVDVMRRFKTMLVTGLMTAGGQLEMRFSVH